MSNINDLKNTFEKLNPGHDFKWQESADESRLQGVCPFHNDHTPSLSVYYGDDGEVNWHCFGCGAGGHLLQAVAMSLGKGSKEAYNYCIQEGIMELNEGMQRKIQTHEVIEKFMGWCNVLLQTSPEAAEVRNYISDRGVDLSLLEKLPIGLYPGKQAVLQWAEGNNVTSEIMKSVLLPTGRCNGKNFLAFFYKDADGYLNFIKVRDVLDQRKNRRMFMFLGDSKTRESSFGFFSTVTRLHGISIALIVEGEFDVMVCLSAQQRFFKNAPLPENQAIISFSGGGNMNKGVVALTKAEAKTIVFPDNDEAGLDYLGKILNAYPYASVIMPNGYGVGEDPADFIKNHSWQDIISAVNERRLGLEYMAAKYGAMYKQAGIEKQRYILHKAINFADKLDSVDHAEYCEALSVATGKPKEILLQGITGRALPVKRASEYCVLRTPEEFGTYRMVTSKNGDINYTKISPVILTPQTELVYENADGSKERKLVFNAEIQGKSAKNIYPSKKDIVDGKKMSGLLVEELGMCALTEPTNIIPLMKATNSIAEENNTKVGQERTVRCYTGWDKNHENFYMPNGVVDKNGFREFTDVSVELGDIPSYYSLYKLLPAANDEEKQRIVEKIKENLLKVFPYSITLPYLAYIFSAPLYSFIPRAKPTILFIYGITGSFKTSYTQVMLSFFGNFIGATLESFTSTINAITAAGSRIKDAPFVVDDYKQSTTNANGMISLIQGAGDRQGRGRLNRNGNMQGGNFIRGNFIATGEDIPKFKEASVLARCFLLPVNSVGDKERLTASQNLAGELPKLMSGFIQFLINKKYPEEQWLCMFDTVRREYKTRHMRTAETAAMLTISWNLLAEYLGIEDLTVAFKDNLEYLLRNMNILVANESAASVFMDTLISLLEDGTVEIIPKDSNFNHQDMTKVVGYHDNKKVYILKGKAMSVVNERLFKMNSNRIQFSPQALMDQLIAENKIIVGGTGNEERSVRVGNGKTIKALFFKKEFFEGTYNTNPMLNDIQ